MHCFLPSHHAAYTGSSLYSHLLKSPPTSNGPESRDLLNSTGIEPIGALTRPYAPPEDSAAPPMSFHARHTPSFSLPLPLLPGMGSTTSGHDITHPIIVILDVPRLVIDSSDSDGDSTAAAVIPVDDFEVRLGEWESIKCKILSWFINTYVLAINSLLPRLETSQAAWSFLATHYNCTYDFALEFHLKFKLYQMRQDLDHDISECFRKQKDDKRKQLQSRGILPRPQAAAVSSAPVDDPVVTVSQLESMFHRYMSQPSLALSVTSGNKSWLLDSACCNHMTPHASHFSQKMPLTPSPIIYTADSSHMSDPLTGKLLRTGRKIGRLFELCNLQIPSHMVSSSMLLPQPLYLQTYDILVLVMPLYLVFIDLYPDPMRDSAPPPSSSDVPSLALSLVAGSPASDPVLSAPSESPTDLRRSTWVRAPPSNLTDYHCYFSLAILYDPHTFHEASTNPLWQQAMADELDAVHKTYTWDMTTVPLGKSAVSCKWVYKIKTWVDGSVERYKARLVAKGFTQEYGIDYEETFALVTRLTSVRSLLAVDVVHHWPLFQMDVKNAFLNGDLLEEVYMFSSVVAQQGFTLSPYDSALFIRYTSTGITLILLYVDDMIITGDDTADIHDLQKFLSQHFEMKDLGTLSYFLGLEVTSSSDGYYFSQAKYASDLLSKAGLTDSKTVSTPLEFNIKLNAIDGEPLPDATLYRQMVGSLIYLTVTRPDLAYAVHLVSQFMFAPHSTHYATVLYWAGDPTDRRFTTGYYFLLGSSLISWRSKKQQSVVARSSTEAEYRALVNTTSELLWLCWLLTDMGAPQTTSTPIHGDNCSAIHIAHNDIFHERTKHIEIDCHFIRYHLQ
uniref:Reverse transcriptase Ty1/copia-type domain-containing protein n=1 Tax=Fagus sylvatica TaxID=28930 RepID=A0A2N9J750_FAGSY